MVYCIGVPPPGSFNWVLARVLTVDYVGCVYYYRSIDIYYYRSIGGERYVRPLCASRFISVLQEWHGILLTSLLIVAGVVSFSSRPSPVPVTLQDVMSCIITWPHCRRPVLFRTLHGTFGTSLAAGQ